MPRPGWMGGVSSHYLCLLLGRLCGHKGNGNGTAAGLTNTQAHCLLALSRSPVSVVVVVWVWVRWLCVWSGPERTKKSDAAALPWVRWPTHKATGVRSAAANREQCTPLSTPRGSTWSRTSRRGLDKDPRDIFASSASLFFVAAAGRSFDRSARRRQGLPERRESAHSPGPLGHPTTTTTPPTTRTSMHHTALYSPTVKAQGARLFLGCRLGPLLALLPPKKRLS